MLDQTGKGMFRLQERQGQPRALSCPKEMAQDMCPPQHESQTSSQRHKQAQDLS